jgi:hypothetical protein
MQVFNLDPTTDRPSIAYASFREWNPDPEIADCAEKLYGDINNLELYVGLQVSSYTSSLHSESYMYSLGGRSQARD